MIKEHTERAIHKLKTQRELIEGGRQVQDFPLEEVLRAILMACETYQNKIVLLSLTAIQRLIHRRALKDGSVAIVINLMKEQALSGDESVHIRVLQTLMASPASMTLVNDLVVEQLMQLLFMLHNSQSIIVHHTACACLRQLAEHLADTAFKAASQQHGQPDLASVKPLIHRSQRDPLPSVVPAQPPATLQGPLWMLYAFIQDLCVMADYDASSMSTRYVVDANERMRTGSREGFWLQTIKFPRPLCLELLATCVSTHPETFLKHIECFTLLRHNVCTALLKNLRGCFDFAILIRCVHLLQQMFKSPALAESFMSELQVFLHLMMDLTNAERSPWQRAVSLEFLKSLCEDPAALCALYGHSTKAAGTASPSGQGVETFLELVNSLSRLIHQVCFYSGMDSGSLLQSGSATAATPASSTGSRASGAGLFQGGMNQLLDRAGMSPLTPESPPPAQSNGGSQPSKGPGPRVKLLQLLSETEPPQISPPFLVCLVVESVYAIVGTLYRLLLDSESSGDAPPSDEPAPLLRVATPDRPLLGDLLRPLDGNFTDSQERCMGMFSESWASLLSALALLLHGSPDEQRLQQTLRCMQTLMYCSGRLGLDQARDAYLMQLARYTLPGPGREGEQEGGGALGILSERGTLGSAPVGGGASPGQSSGPTTKNIQCFKALLQFCASYGGLLTVPGWTIALRAIFGLERCLQRFAPGADAASLKTSITSLLEATGFIPPELLREVVQAFRTCLRGAHEYDEGLVVLNRLVELCGFNLSRLLLFWDLVLQMVTEVCTSEERRELRGAAAAALCSVVAQALRRGVLVLSQRPEAAQVELLRPLEALLQVPSEETRARVCEGLLTMLQASGQELEPPAWGMMVSLVAKAADVELQKAGLDPRSEAGRVGKAPVPDQRGGDFSALPTIFQLLELMVHDFMENVPPDSVPMLTASLGAFARFTGLGVNSSLTAVGFLWNAADALARQHCGKPDAPAQAFEELWVQIFLQLRLLAGDPRPEVRNCAVKSLTTALLSHGRKVGIGCYSRCLSDIIIKVLGEIQESAQEARQNRPSLGAGGREGLIVHHSRDTPEKQWDETMVLAVEGVRRVLSHFSEEAPAEAYSPLAYSLLLQVQSIIQALSPEVSGSGMRVLVDLMRIPASAQMVDAVVLNSSPQCPAAGTTSIWELGWHVLWSLVQFCLIREVPEALVESFTSALSSLRQTHQQHFRPAQDLVLLQLGLVLVTAPSFSLPSSVPFRANGEESKEGLGTLRGPRYMSRAVECCKEAGLVGAAALDQEVFSFVEASSEALWRLELRTKLPTLREYTKASVPPKNLLDPNGSRNSEILGMDALVALAAAGPEEAVQGLLTPTRTPTHRNMLHIATSRLPPAQSAALALFEETLPFTDPAMQVQFLFQCCAVLLNPDRIVEDMSKVALASRALPLILGFTRRVLLQHLPRHTGAQSANSAMHLEALLGEAMPVLCQVMLALCGAHTDELSHKAKALKELGVWKLALEALAYLIEDTMPAVAVPSVSQECVAKYWDAVSGALALAVAQGLPESSRTEFHSANLLAQVLGNLLGHRLIPSPLTPDVVAEDAVEYLKGLARLESGTVSRSLAPSEGGSLSHLFHLCQKAAPSPVRTSELQLSVAALTASGAAASMPRTASAQRKALLRAAVPALLAHTRGLFAAAASSRNEATITAADGEGQDSRQSEEVCFVLQKLKTLRVDETGLAEACAAAPEAAREACRLAGTKGMTMALLPQIAGLSTSSDPAVRQCVREVLEDLSNQLQL